MGCDIHMIAEKRSKYDDDTHGWEPMLTPIFKDSFYRDSEVMTDYNKPYTFQPYDDRSYIVFSVLAGVRNGHELTPISEPRGYPEDMHKVSEWLLDGWDFVDHSPTWLTLDEVMAYNWSGTFNHSAWVDFDHYQSFKDNGKPDEYCSWATGPQTEHIALEDMEALHDGSIQKIPGVRYYTTVEWTDTISDYAKEFLANMKVLHEYAVAENCDVRLVFGFDN